MASMSTVRALIFSRVTALSAKSLPPSFSCSLPKCRNRPSPALTVSCCLNDGGVFDDYSVSTQKSNLDRGFIVIANMLKQIEPLDTSVISKGVSDSAKEAMKRTISSMLGILPSDQFSVLVSLSEPPLHRLLFSSIITGYTLWNAEYRISLMRNLQRTAPEDEVVKQSVESTGKEQREVQVVEKNKEEEGENGEYDALEDIRQRVFGDLSPEALKYIEKLQAELSDLEEELSDQKKENVRIECDTENMNGLLEYLRSLDANMVTELSQPSSVQAEEMIHQLVQNILQRFFKDAGMKDSGITNTGNHQDAADENCGTFGTSRDYLAKLLFWCMLLGHHLRGLENRLHLSCVVGLL